MKHVAHQGTQQGVAVVTALLLTTLAITIVASLFWQQQVQVRSIENQRYQLQKKWVLRGALDWAAMILREDKHSSAAVDHLGEPWAVSLGETRLDQYVENGKTDVEDSEASLSGQISDAQAKFNLTNLSNNGVVDVVEQAAFAKLLRNLRLDTSLAQHVAAQVAMTQDKVASTSSGGSSNPNDPQNPGNPQSVSNPQDPQNLGKGALLKAGDPGTGGGSKGQSNNDSGDKHVGILNSEVQFLKFSQIDDLLAVPGFNSEIVAKLRPFVTVLPMRTKINVNTTTAEVLSARIENLSMSDAALMIAARDRAYFLGFPNFKAAFEGKIKDSANELLDFQTSYFIINGRVKLNRSFLEVNALFERVGTKTQVVWIRES